MPTITSKRDTWIKQKFGVDENNATHYLKSAFDDKTQWKSVNERIARVSSRGIDVAALKYDFPKSFADRIRPYIRPDCHKPLVRKLADRIGSQIWTMLKAFLPESESTEGEVRNVHVLRRSACSIFCKRPAMTSWLSVPAL